jgi:hypothetical protein
MSWRFPVNDIIVKYWIGGTIWLILFAALYILSHHKFIQTIDTVTSTFQRGDCFQLIGHDEDWETIPDGIIERVGNKSYLVIWKDQAEKRGGDKYGSTIEIKVFDELNEKVPCPETWVKHSHKGN